MPITCRIGPCEMTRDQELWGMALWVEKKHGDEGWLFIAQQQDRWLAEGDLDGMKLWREVDVRFTKLVETQDAKLTQ